MDPESFKFEPALAPQIVDQHDYMPVSGIEAVTASEPAMMANVFRSDCAKILEEISCTTASDVTVAQYAIYLLRNGFTSPEDGLKMTEGMFAFEYAGFHRIPLEEEIIVQEGQYYSVVLTLVDADGNYVINKPTAVYSPPYVAEKAVINEKESYIFKNGAWSDYKPEAETEAAGKSAEAGAYGISLSFDNFPIKTYGVALTGNLSMRFTGKKLTLYAAEGLNQDNLELVFSGISAFEIGNPKIDWKLLPGSEEIVEIEPIADGSKVRITAKAHGTMTLAVTAEGVGTLLFTDTIKAVNPASVIPLLLTVVYTGEAVTIPVHVATADQIVLTEGVHYATSCSNNVNCGVARVAIIPIGIGTDPTAELVTYFVIVPPKPEITALTAENGTLKVAVKDLSEIGASGYEAEYRLKDTDQWTVVPFEAGQTELLIKGRAAGDYEVRVHAFVDTTGAEKNFLIMDINYGEYSDVMTVTVK